jgi:hypothetical protein
VHEQAAPHQQVVLPLEVAPRADAALEERVEARARGQDGEHAAGRPQRALVGAREDRDHDRDDRRRDECLDVADAAEPGRRRLPGFRLHSCSIPGWQARPTAVRRIGYSALALRETGLEPAGATL